MSHRSAEAIERLITRRLVIVEQSTQALLSMDSTITDRRRALDQRVLQTLMIPLAMVVCNELGHRSSEMSFAQWNHPVEALLLY